MTSTTERSPAQLSNLLLIGMPGSGKSTLGKALAQHLQRPWVDTDHLLEETEQQDLHQILKRLGPEKFKSLESQVLSTVDLVGHVISSGGSVVYSQEAMEHLRSSCYTIFLNTPLEDLQSRIKDLGRRGTVHRPGQTLADLFFERLPLYQRYQDLEVHTGGLDEKALLQTLLERLHL